MGDGLVAAEHPIPNEQWKSCEDWFIELCPYYMSMGMTYDQFWHDDPFIAKQYRLAEELRKEKKNQELWLQGIYFTHAISACFSENNSAEYPREPLPITARDIARKKETERRAYERKVHNFKLFAELRNIERAKQRGELSGTND